uniref:C-type lectin domain-containing protein n=1 Tax=Rhabditophanes sp. KR3021 TaxID=114890 RepID=A0AC35THI9_9BILA
MTRLKKLIFLYASFFWGLTLSSRIVWLEFLLPDSWVKYGDSCFLILRHKLSFDGAEHACNNIIPSYGTFQKKFVKLGSLLIYIHPKIDFKNSIALPR